MYVERSFEYVTPTRFWVTMRVLLKSYMCLAHWHIHVEPLELYDNFPRPRTSCLNCATLEAQLFLIFDGCFFSPRLVEEQRRAWEESLETKLSRTADGVKDGERVKFQQQRNM